MTCKWLITMVIVSPLRIGIFPFQMGVSWLINGGDPNHLLTGMILQVPSLKLTFSHLKIDCWNILLFLLGWPIFRGEL